jgi:hypothetical protein
MLDSVSSIAAFATQNAMQNTSQQLDVAMLKKAHEMQTQQGKNELSLIASATAPMTSVDLHV